MLRWRRLLLWRRVLAADPRSEVLRIDHGERVLDVRRPATNVGWTKLSVGSAGISVGSWKGAV